MPELELALSWSPGLSRRGIPAAISFRRWLEAALDEVGADSAGLALRIVDEHEGHALNRHWRGRDHATNVLSFPADLPEALPERWLGDIVLCAPLIAREADAQGKPPRAHWAHLAVHGLLHLLGHDHIDPAQAEAMEAMETRILARLGFPDPYQDPGPAPARRQRR